MAAHRARIGSVFISLGLAGLAILIWPPEPSPAAGQLVAAYDFNENAGITLDDVGGNAHHGAIEGATWTTSGRYGNALAFDGVDDRVTVPHSSPLDLSTGFSIEMWVNWAGVAQWQTLVIKEGSGQETYGMWVSPDGASMPGASSARESPTAR